MNLRISCMTSQIHGKTNLPVRDQLKEDEDTQLLHNQENLVMPPDIILTFESIEEEREDADPGFTFNPWKGSKRRSKI